MRDLSRLCNNHPTRWLTIAAAMFLAVVPARAQDRTQDAPDERRCTGQLRASVDDRIASCTALINSGRYQPVNLAILHDNRGVALRAKGDLTGTRKDFDDAIALNPGYARAFANRASLQLSQRDLDGAITDLDQAIKL